MKTSILLAFAGALSAAAPAAATVITFDTLPNGTLIADGTPIGTQFASLGVTFSGLNGTTPVLPISTNYAGGPEGPNYQRNFLGNSSNGQPGNPRYGLVTITFASAASNVSFSLNNFFTAGATTFNAYNAAGTLLQSLTTTASSGWDIRTLSATGIARIDMIPNTFSNTGGNTFYGIDNLNFTLAATPAVPEPASWALMIVGFGMTGASMRYRQRRTAVRYA